MSSVRVEIIDETLEVELLDNLTVSGSGLTPTQLGRLLPAFPALGSRDGKVPQFTNDVLGWVVLRGVDQVARDAAANAENVASANARELGNLAPTVNSNRLAIANLAEVARTGAYADLTGKPDIPDEFSLETQPYNDMLAAATQGARIYTDDLLESIVQRDDLDGDYRLVLDNLNDISDRLVDATNIQIFIQGSDRSTTQVHQEDWTRVQARRVIPFNISDAEESGAASKFQRHATGRQYYHFIVVFRNGNQPVFTIEGDDSPRLWIQANTIPLATKASVTAVNTRIDDLPEPSSEDATAREAAAAAQRTADDADATAGAARVLAEQLGLRFTFDPPYFVRDTGASPDARVVVIHFDSGFLPRDATHLGFNLQGVNASARLEVSTTETYAFTIPSAGVANVSRHQGVLAEGTLTFWSAASGGSPAGAEIRNSVRLVAVAPAGAADVQANLDTEVASRTAADTELGTRISGVEVRTPRAMLQLRDAATIVWDADDGIDASVVLNGNRTLALPTNLRVGQTLRLIVSQDVTGGRTLSFGEGFLFPGGTDPVLSSAGASIDVLTFWAIASNRLLGVPALLAFS